jgi:hypothetical protein
MIFVRQVNVNKCYSDFCMMQSWFIGRTLSIFTALLIFLTHQGNAQTGSITTARTSPRGVISFSEAVTTGIWPGNYIDGYVKKYGSALFIYPVGDQGVSQPFAAAADRTTGAYFHENPDTATLPSGAPFSANKRDQWLARVRPTGYWDIDGSNPTKLTLTWDETTGVSGLTDHNLSRLTIAGWHVANARWENIPSGIDPVSLAGGVSSLTSGSITTTAALIPDTYNVYTLAQTVSGPLPVTLLSFTAVPDGEFRAILNWRTTFETNSLYFDIEHSSTGKIWTKKGRVLAKGEGYADLQYYFTDDTPVSGENLYRLKMLDRDSTFSYSKIQSVIIAGGPELSLFPNPTADRLYFDARILKNVKSVTLFRLTGQQLYNSTTVSAEGLDVRHLADGIYLVKVLLQDGTPFSQKIVVRK